MRQYIYKLVILCLLLLPAALRAQEIVDPGGPEDPSTGDKNITVVQAAGGSILPQGTQGIVTVHSGTDKTFSIRPADGFEIATVLADGLECALEDKDRAAFTYVFTNIVKDHTLTATFRPIRFTLIATAGEGGSVVPVSAIVSKGTSQLFTFTPAAGYQVDDVKVDGLSVGAVSSYTIENIVKDSKVEATFKGIEYTVTLRTPENGRLSVTAGGEEVSDGDRLAYGTTLTLVSFPVEGYKADKLTVNGRLFTSGTCKVEGDLVFDATFKKMVYPVTVKAPENGTLTVKNGQQTLQTGIHQVEYGTVLTLENRASANYLFDVYQVVPEAVLEENQVTVTGAVSIGAAFRAQSYKVTVTAPEEAEGKLTVDGKTAVTGEKEYPYGTVLALGNTPAEGKVFVSYQLTPSSALSGNLVTVTGDLQVAIRFKAAPAGEDTTDPEDGKKLYAVTFVSPLVVRSGENSLRSGEKVKEGTVLNLTVPNTNSRRLTSLTANGNPVDYLTTVGLNTAIYEVKSAVDFRAGFQENTFPVLLSPSEGGTLQAQVGNVAVVSGSNYLYGSTVSVTATPEKGYTLTRILAGGTDITLSRCVTLTEDLVLSAVFTKEGGLKPNPDPSVPDPDAPAGIDLSVQRVVYNRQVQAFEIRTMPGGIVDNISVVYRQDGKNVRPLNAGLYDVTLSRPGDSRFAAFNETIPGGLEISKAPVTLTEIDYKEEQLVGTMIRTIATLKGGKASYVGQEVKGMFTWVSPEASNGKLTVSASGYEEVCFTPEDASDYQPATARVYIRVGEAPATTYKTIVKVEGKGNVSLFSGDLLYSSEGPFYEGMALTLKAVAGEGYRFAGFFTEGVLYEANPYSFTVTKDRELTARFLPKEDPANPSDPASPEALKVTLTLPVSPVYDGKPKLASVSSQPALTGWQLEYRDKDDKAVIPVEAGSYEVTVSRKEDNTWLAYKETSSFTIARAVPSITTAPFAEALPAGAPLEDTRLNGGVAEAPGYGVVPGSFEWLEPRKTITADTKETFRFSPSDAVNFYSVTGETGVKVLAVPPAPRLIQITYSQSAGGSLSVRNEESGLLLSSGSLLTEGTRIRIEMKPGTYFKLGTLQIGAADYTADAINGQGTVVRAMHSTAEIKATFVRTSYPPDPDPDPKPDPTPDPDPVPTPEYTLMIRKTGLGTITPESRKVKEGESVTFTVTPGYSQQLVDVRLNGNSVGAVTQYTLRNIREDATLEAVFCNIGIPVYTLTSKSVGAGGYVTPSIVRVAEGSNHQFVIHTYSKKQLCDVQVGTKEQLKSVGTPGSYIFQSVASDSLLVASFGQPTAIESKEGDGRGRVYASGNCLIVRPMSTVSVLRVYSLGGRLLLQKRLSGGEIMQVLPEGIYITELIEPDRPPVHVKVKIDK